MTDEGKPNVVRPLPSWVPAGWYPDPLGQGAARYWDGKRWSLHYRDDPPPQPVPTSPSEVPASSPPADASGAPTGSTASESDPATKGYPSAWDRWKEIPIAARIAVGVVVLLIIIGVASSGGKKTTGSATATQSASATTPTTTTASPPVALNLATGDYSVTASHTTLRGTVSAGATVTVAGGQAQVRGTHWSHTVALEIGPNSEDVEATMPGHEPASRTITVIRHHTQAELEAKAQAKRAAEQHEKEEQARTESKEREQKEIESATLSQQNALHEAESYLQSSSFSEAGLIEQLSSEAGSKFPLADAEWAVHHLHVDWNEQAVKEAKSYLSSSSFSCEGLIEQLSSQAGSKFTQAQAEYGAKQAGIC